VAARPAGTAGTAAVAAGRGPGEVALDIAIADLPEEDREAIVRIQGGLDLDQFQAEQVARWASELGIRLTELEQRGAIGIADLMVRVWIADQQLLAAGEAGRLGDVSPNTLFDQLGQAMLAIRDQPDTNEELIAQIARYNVALQNLTRMGLMPANPDGSPVYPLLPTNPRELTPGMVRRAWRATFGARSREEIEGIGRMPGGPMEPSDLIEQQLRGMSVDELLDIIRDLMGGDTDG
jgi:hypothetical protein